ncbi:HAD family hydrolase [Campylobacter blaseri]|uniref:phosphoglycolate phosphatase n=1 Tax=Campylobacter blaseri TaxID=2042961 RepID=A0A2P8QZH1_9BACT|nr:HAD family hydrolase [Campylobacter blaseri]PSM51633.1 hydrolase [Campylobacter blaseri]PSM53426.1 hydrolase [Campylobacter blaseri]
MKKPTILFDLDGTLIDSTQSILDGFKFAFLENNIKYPCDEFVKNLIGYPLEIMFKNLGVKADQIDELVKSYKKRYRTTYLEKTTLLPEAEKSILMAYEFADIGVVTTKTSKYSRVLLENLGIAYYFKVIIGRDDVVNPKPDAEPILKALKNMQKDRLQAYMIGDTKLDALAALSAKIQPICVTCGYGKKEDLLKHTNQVFDKTIDAVQFIKKELN